MLAAGAFGATASLTTGVVAADSLVTGALAVGVLEANVLIAPPSPIVVEPVGL